MRTVKLVVGLPVLFCGIEGMLWYWDLHSLHSVPSFNGGETAAAAISMGLDFPAALLTTVIALALEGILRRVVIGTLVGRGVFLLCVAGSWCSIGYWLESRFTTGDRLKPQSIIWYAVLVFGVITLLISFHLRVYCFAQVAQRALLQTWGVFLIGFLVLGIIRSASDAPQEPPAETVRRKSQRLSNFRLLVVVLGVFAALLLMGLPPGPLIAK